MTDPEDERLYAEGAPPGPNAPLDTESQSQADAAEKRRQREDAERLEVAQAMLSTKAGRAFLAYLMFDLCGFTGSTVAAAPTAEGLHASNLFRAGQRDVALRVHQMLRRADKTGYVVLLSEHLDQM